ncbi:MAG: hypothetical protein ACXABY_14325 [Candidatus Thorarchaeota archaeon]
MKDRALCSICRNTKTGTWHTVEGVEGGAICSFCYVKHFRLDTFKTPNKSTIQGPCTYCGSPKHWRPDCNILIAHLNDLVLFSRAVKLLEEIDQNIHFGHNNRLGHELTALLEDLHNV